MKRDAFYDGGTTSYRASVLQMEATKAVKMRHLGQELLRSKRRQLSVADRRSEHIAIGSDSDRTTRTEEVTALWLGNAGNCTCRVFDEIDLDSTVIIRHADKAKSIASERTSIELDADVEILSRGRTEALSWRLAWIECQCAELLAITL